MRKTRTTGPDTRREFLDVTKRAAPNIFRIQFHKKRNQTPINTLSQKETPKIYKEYNFPQETVKFILKRSGDKIRRRASLTNCRKWFES